MFARRLLMLTALAALATVWLSRPVAMSDQPDAKPASHDLETIRQLAGTWVEVGDDGQPTDRVVSVFRVTAGGSAVVETLFPGSDHEMMTVYHMQGQDLVLTHYCVAGNQPTMKAGKGKGKTLIFECRDKGHADIAKQAHMHHATFELLDQDQMKTEWVMIENGEPTYTVKFHVARKKS